MLERTTLQLFRDCLRTAHHIGGDSAKGRALKQVVKDGFRKHIGVTDAAEIEKLKADAVRALSNYLVMKSLNKSKEVMNRSFERTAMSSRSPATSRRSSRCTRWSRRSRPRLDGSRVSP